MSKEAAKTGSEPTVLCALEQNFPIEKRVLVDELSYKIQPAEMRLFIKLLKPFMNMIASSSEKKRCT
ncbi:MAG: hypothetical protein QJR05_08535, partial [Thermoanaerobacterium sp.]|nr:hypothetical protein [Thermoanaerobacterium sp.]